MSAAPGETPGLWRALFEPASVRPPASPALRAAAARLGALTSPALADFLLAPAAARLGAPLLDPEAVAGSRLLARFTRAAQLDCAAAIAEAGIPAVYLKGFANAHTLYPEPELRLFGDLDVLLAPEDLDGAIALLAARGFTFRPGRGPAWGFQPEGSFVPFASPDDACNLDLHILPDGYPVSRALTTARLFAAARELRLGSVAIRVPSREHAFVLCLSNIAKDKFGPYAVRKLVDALRLLTTAPALDWSEVLALVREGRLLRPARAMLALLARLGARLPPLPAGVREGFGWPASAELDRLVADYERLFAGEPGPLRGLWREALLGAAPGVALRLNLRRCLGLLRPRRGIPPGWERAAAP